MRSSLWQLTLITNKTLQLSPRNQSWPVQVFYEEFGELMMEQPVIGLDFQTWLPVAIVPYILLLSFNLFNRCAELPGAEMGAV